MDNPHTAATDLKPAIAVEASLHQSALARVQPNMVAQTLAQLHQLPLPTTRSEAWRYTRTARLAQHTWKISHGRLMPDISPWRVQGLDTLEIVFVNGFLMPVNEKPPQIAGLHLHTAELHSAWPAASFPHNEQSDIFSALHLAHCTSALHIEVDKEAAVEKIIHLIFIQSENYTLAQPRIHCTLHSGASLQLLTTTVSTAPETTFLNGEAHVHLAHGARLVWNKIQQDNRHACSLWREYVSQDAHSSLTINTITTGGAWVRNNVQVDLHEPQAECHLNGLYIPGAAQLMDNHTRIDHRAPHCTSNELYKGVVSSNGHAVFNGKVQVWPHAQKTNAYQSNANLVLSDEAKVNTKPELEIYADDVKCSHGSTTGQIDDEALFYLRSRGMSSESAMQLLVSAFASAVIDKVHNEPVRAHLHSLLNQNQPPA